MLVIAASGPPAEHSTSDMYGTLNRLRLAQRLRPGVVALLDCLNRYGATPQSFMPAPSVMSAPSPAAQNPSYTYAAFPLNNAVHEALDAFGGGVLDDP